MLKKGLFCPTKIAILLCPTYVKKLSYTSFCRTKTGYFNICVRQKMVKFVLQNAKKRKCRTKNGCFWGCC